MIRFIGTSLQLKLIMTVHNHWLSETRSILYWTTSAFSSTVTKNLFRLNHWTLRSAALCWTFSRALPFITSGEGKQSRRLKHALYTWWWPIRPKHVETQSRKTKRWDVADFDWVAQGRIRSRTVFEFTPDEACHYALHTTYVQVLSLDTLLPDTLRIQIRRWKCLADACDWIQSLFDFLQA
jgi:hypothetical protein